MNADQENLELADSAKIPETEAQEKRDNQAGAQLTKALKAIVVWSILLLLIVPPFGILAFISACLTKLSKTEKRERYSFGSLKYAALPVRWLLSLE